MATPAPPTVATVDAVVAMRSESRTGPRAMAAVIFSFCFFEMLVFVLRAADRHTLAAQRSAGKHPHAHAGVCTDGSDAQRPRECYSATVALQYSSATVALPLYYPYPTPYSIAILYP